MILKRFGLLVVLMIFCTHCTDGSSSPKAGGIDIANTDSTVVREIESISHAEPKVYGVQKANVDPETGEWVGPPEHDGPVDAGPIEASDLSKSAEKMEEKSSPVPGGGMMIDLKGRFQSHISATIESNGKTKIEHPVNEKRP
jgi:hypothetical protein